MISLARFLDSNKYYSMGNAELFYKPRESFKTLKLG